MPRVRQPVVYEFQVDLGTPVTDAALPSVVGALLKHLQYSRGQCTAPVDRLVAGFNVAVTTHQQGKSKRVPASLRRIGKYLAQLHGQLDALRDLPLEPLLTRRASLAVLLGATPLRPREVYLIRFDAGLDSCTGATRGSGVGGLPSHHEVTGTPCAASAAVAADTGRQRPACAAACSASVNGGCNTVLLPQAPPEEARALDTAGKRLLRGLIVQGSAVEEWADVCAPTKTYLMVQAPAGQPLGGCYLPRRGFCLGLRKGFQVSLDVRFNPPINALRALSYPAAPQQLGRHASWGGIALGAGAAAPVSAERRGRKRRQAASQHTAQTLEEHLEASMQLCTSSESEGEGGGGSATDRGHQGMTPSGIQASEAAAAAENSSGSEAGAGRDDAADDPDALVWYQCRVAVKGMRQEKQPG